MGDRFGPRHFTGHTKQRGDRVIAERDDGLCVFPAGAGDIDQPIDGHICASFGEPGLHSAHLGDLK